MSKRASNAKGKGLRAKKQKTQPLSTAMSESTDTATVTESKKSNAQPSAAQPSGTDTTPPKAKNSKLPDEGQDAVAVHGENTTGTPITPASSSSSNAESKSPPVPEMKFNVFMQDYQLKQPLVYLTASSLEPWTEIRPRLKAGIRRLKRLILSGG